MDYFHAFWVGGLICALAQILLERTKMLPGRIMVLLVCLGAVLSFIGLYEPLAEFAGAGVTVPLMGFGHNLMKGVREAVDENGFIGLFMGGFKYRRGAHIWLSGESDLSAEDEEVSSSI